MQVYQNAFWAYFGLGLVPPLESLDTVMILQCPGRKCQEQWSKAVQHPGPHVHVLTQEHLSWGLAYCACFRLDFLSPLKCEKKSCKQLQTTQTLHIQINILNTRHFKVISCKIFLICSVHCSSYSFLTPFHPIQEQEWKCTLIQSDQRKSTLLKHANTKKSPRFDAARHSLFSLKCQRKVSLIFVIFLCLPKRIIAFISWSKMNSENSDEPNIGWISASSENYSSNLLVIVQNVYN